MCRIGFALFTSMNNVIVKLASVDVMVMLAVVAKQCLPVWHSIVLLCVSSLDSVFSSDKISDAMKKQWAFCIFHLHCLCNCNAHWFSLLTYLTVRASTFGYFCVSVECLKLGCGQTVDILIFCMQETISQLKRDSTPWVDFVLNTAIIKFIKVLHLLVFIQSGIYWSTMACSNSGTFRSCEFACSIAVISTLNQNSSLINAWESIFSLSHKMCDLCVCDIR